MYPQTYRELFLLAIVVIFVLLLLVFFGKNRKIKTQKDKLKMAMDYLFDGLIMVDRFGYVSKVSPAAEKMLGIKEKKVVGKKLTKKPSNPYHANLYEVISVMLKKGKREWEEILIEKPQELVLKVTPVPVFDKRGKPSGYLYVLHDMTREKEIDKIKSEFLTVVAHKLRTPLSEIKWEIEALIDEPEKLSSAQKEILMKCRTTNNRITAQLNGLLNVSEIEKGLFKYKFKFESLENVVGKIVQEMSEFAKDQGVSLKYQEPSASLPKVKIDEEKVDLVVHNLVDNAIRYTPKGGKVEVKIVKKEKFLVFSVSDTGIGIPQTEKKRVFTKFFREKRALKIYTEGMGLNLFVVKNIIERHNGEVWFESAEGKGSTFYFKLPIS